MTQRKEHSSSKTSQATRVTGQIFRAALLRAGIQVKNCCWLLSRKWWRQKTKHHNFYPLKINKWTANKNKQTNRTNKIPSPTKQEYCIQVKIAFGSESSAEKLEGINFKQNWPVRNIKSFTLMEIRCKDPTGTQDLQKEIWGVRKDKHGWVIYRNCFS